MACVTLPPPTPVVASSEGVRRPHHGAGSHGLCMLTVVYEPHFPQLARRMNLTLSLVVGPPPTTIVVFDDQNATDAFCRQHAPQCHRARPYFAFQNLADMIGIEAYAQARAMLRAARARSIPFSAGECRGRRISDACQGCRWKSTGRCYQALKKFYGAVHAPSFCQRVHVSDAESFPFRPFNFERWAKAEMKEPPRQLVASWFPAAYASGSASGTNGNLGCVRYKHDEHTDPSCSLRLARVLRLPHLWDNMSPFGVQRAFQTDFDYHNWWIYEPRTMLWIIRRTELMVGVPFVKFWVGTRSADAFFYNWHVSAASILEFRSRQMIASTKLLHDEGLGGILTRSVNVLETIKAYLPTAYAACCRCENTSVQSATRQPCHSEEVLWSSCVARHASPKQVGSLLVDGLGMFGLFGAVINSVPRRLLEAEPRLSWVINGNLDSSSISRKITSLPIPGWEWPSKSKQPRASQPKTIADR